MEEIVPKIESVFKNWQPGDIPEKNIGHVDLPDSTRIYLVDRPDAAQSFLFGTHLTVPKANPDEAAIQLMTDVFGGGSTARINMNLREDKHWSYGAYSGVVSAKGQRAFYIIASVQTDKTKESIAESMKELRSFLGDNPATGEEVLTKKTALTQSLAGTWETASAVSGSISQIVQYGLPDDYFKTYGEQVDKLTQSQVIRASQKVIKPDNMVWVVVGDRAKVEAGLAELGYGEVIGIDADGNLLENPSASEN
jgi:zinc protease